MPAQIYRDLHLAVSNKRCEKLGILGDRICSVRRCAGLDGPAAVSGAARARKLGVDMEFRPDEVLSLEHAGRTVDLLARINEELTEAPLTGLSSELKARWAEM
jgi:hypothetical protein